MSERCTCHEICASRFTTCCACHEICTSRFTKCCASHEICKRATCPKVTIRCTRLSRNLISSTITTMSKALHLPRKLHFKIEQLRSLADFEARKHEVSLAPATKSAIMCGNAHGATTRAQSLEAPAVGAQTLRACAVEMHIDDVERHECTVNSSELAGHGRALQRSKHQLPSSYSKCLGKKLFSD